MKKGFTLIELLIVVAIIAILAAIAVPNFLEAQVRSKVARVKNDERTLTLAIECYMIDNNRPPLDFVDVDTIYNLKIYEREMAYNQLTTPIAYMSGYLSDPFAIYTTDVNPNQRRDEQKFYYYCTSYVSSRGTYAANLAKRIAARRCGYTYGFFSMGPVAVEHAPFPEDLMQGAPSNNAAQVAQFCGRLYDPTNGTISDGRIVRTNKGYYAGSEVARDPSVYN